VSVIGYTSDGDIAVTASYDGTLTTWLVTDTGPLRLTGLTQAHDDAVTGVVFSPDNRTLFTTSRDGTLRRWDTGQLVDMLADPTRLACALAGGGLEKEDWSTYVVNEPYRDTCP
jgi:WD40 repeat protein